MSIVNESLWDDVWIKQMMDRIATDSPMSPFMTATSSTTYDPKWNIDAQPKEYMTEFAQSVKKEKVEESLNSDAQFFDPKELDIDD
jgi:hypothetical protein